MSETVKSDIIIREFPKLRINQNDCEKQDFIELRNDQIREYRQTEQIILENERVGHQTDRVYLELFNDRQLRHRVFKKSTAMDRAGSTLNYNYFNLKSSALWADLEESKVRQSKCSEQATQTREQVITKIRKEFRALRNDERDAERQEQQINIILEKRFFYDHSVLVLSCEFLMLNEACFDFEFSFKENNFLYDTVDFDNLKCQKKLKNIQVYQEELLQKNMVSLQPAKQIRAKWKSLLGENKEFLNFFTGNFTNQIKNLVFYEKKKMRTAINFFKRKTHEMSNVSVKANEEVPREGEE